jgi:type II secretory pathway pseudopilin PulG
VRNKVIVLLIVSVAALGVLLYRQTASLREQRRQVQELNAKLASMSQAADFDLQAKCAKQAGDVWKAGGWDRKKMATYSNHYNEKLKKCFIQIEATTEESGADVTFETVMDALESKGYAEFIWKVDHKSGDSKSMRCSAILPSGEAITCTSPEEFDALVKQYME